METVTTVKRRRRRRRKQPTVVESVTTRSVPGPKPNAPKPKRKRRGRKTGFSPQGLAFLKAATAPRDFSMDCPAGIPDLYQGHSLTCEQKLDFTVQGTGGTQYFAFTPSPNIACFVGVFSASCLRERNENLTEWLVENHDHKLADYGASVVGPSGIVSTYQNLVDAGEVPPVPDAWALAPKYYGDNRSLFPSGNDENAYLSQFRCMGYSVEATYTGRELQAAGSYTIAKLNPTVSFTPGAVGEAGKKPTTPGVPTFGPLTFAKDILTLDSCYIGKVSDGFYSYSMPNDTSHSWTPVQPGVGKIGVTLNSTGGAHALVSVTTAPFVGVAPWETIACVVEGMGTTNSVNISIRSFWEFIPSEGSSFSKFAHMSPAPDMAAVEALDLIRPKLPIAVTRANNSGFWSKVVSAIRSVGKFVVGAAEVVVPIAKAMAMV